ncbi:MAG: glycosyltransferase family 39 protein [Flavobacteriales bacterium]|nr:glycosyltransferase family 39 protein [Flavobacteriales bacterium]
MERNYYKYYVACIVGLCAVFVLTNNIPNRAPLVIDSFEYHILGVNLSKGKGFNTMGIYGDLESYRFNYEFNNDVTYPTSPLLFKIMLELNDVKYFFRDPGYSIFLAVVYSIFGVNPFVVYCLQVFMLTVSLIVLPSVFDALLGRCGFYASLITGILMFFFYRNYAFVYLTEIFEIFLLSIAVFSIIKFKGSVSLLIACLFLGLGLLTKGSMYLLVPFIVLFAWSHRGIKSKSLVTLVLLAFATLFIPLIWSAYANYHDNQNKQHQIVSYQKFCNTNLTSLIPKINSSSLQEHEKARIINSGFNLQNERDQSQVFFDEGIKLILEEAFYARQPFFISRRFSKSLIDCNNEYLIDATNPHWIKWRLIEDNPYLIQLRKGKTQVEIVLNMIVSKPLVFSKIIAVKILYFFKTVENMVLASSLLYLLCSIFIGRYNLISIALCSVPLVFFVLNALMPKGSSLISWMYYLSALGWFVFVVVRTSPLWKKTNHLIWGVLTSTALFSFILFPVDRIIAVPLFFLFPVLFFPSFQLVQRTSSHR